MTFRPFFARLIVAFAALLALIVAVCGVTIYLAGREAVRAQQIASLERLAPLVRGWLADGRSSAAAGVDGPTRKRLADAAEVLDTRISVIAADGRVVVDTLVPLEQMDDHNDRPEVVAARRGEVGRSVRRSRSLSEPSIYVAVLADPARPDGLVVRVSYPQRSWAKYGASVWVTVAGSVLAALLAAGALWLILQRRWIGPTFGLVRAAERMAAGDWHARAEPRGADELQFFSTRLNLVASHAQRQLADLKAQRADLQALVDTLPDPVLATDPAGQVILINQPAARLLALSPAKVLGQHVVSVVNDEAVLRLFERARATTAEPDDDGSRNGNGQPPTPAPPGRGFDGTRPQDAPPDPIHLIAVDADDHTPPLTREIRLNRDGQWLTFQAVAKRTAGGGVLLVLRDVTALTSTVQMKTDFVANASHELRTPIAAIKIAFETLREVYEDDAAQSERCMSIIDGHLRRLEEMLRDLLDLSRVENPNLKPHVKGLKTIDVIAHLRSSLGPMARQKGVELRLGEGLGRDPALPTEFACDERLLHLILKNLVENSVKYTPAGGLVTVAFTRGGPGGNVAGHGGGAGGPAHDPPVLLTVRDTGIGIPPEHLDRVFERFYQVDAARSGSAGRGTGLGLAIVKHAINALGGAVHLESTVGKGTTVTCTLPQGLPEEQPDEVGV